MDDGLDLTLLPAAVSPLVAGEVAGAPRRCRVLAAFPTCLYLDLGAHERVLAVLASDAVALPIGIRLALPSTEVRWGVEPGTHVVVGEGRVRLPRADVVAARLLRPARVRPAPRGSASSAALPEPGVLGDLAHDLTAAALAGRSAEPGVRGLVGVGRGLTPSGDDALCGVLLTLAAVDAPSSRRALSAVRDRRPRCAAPDDEPLGRAPRRGGGRVCRPGRRASRDPRRRGRVDRPERRAGTGRHSRFRWFGPARRTIARPRRPHRARRPRARHRAHVRSRPPVRCQRCPPCRRRPAHRPTTRTPRRSPPWLTTSS